jgi:3-isopropylmalate/(R)-2-methylmalate dehydratase small subunit
MSTQGAHRVVRVEGRALPLRGHDIDTDRVIPARYLRAVSFEGLEAHVFEDERKSWSGPGPHPFDAPQYRYARLLVVNRNFGCGSSREHAPQAIQRWGIHAVLGESFSEIFFGNSLALGMPCVTLSSEDATWLQRTVEATPDTHIVLDLVAGTVTAAGRTLVAGLPPSARDAFVTGAWDATGLLLENFPAVDEVARRLPYVGGF